MTGTWRVSPPGRFWVNGYWKRDDKGWFRVPGFWSDRKTDRIDFRKDGPPADRPAEEPGESPGPDHFYIPGQYVPDGDGVVWKPGFWAKSQPGWAWVPAQWVQQPEGWTFQEGYWDRVLEDRGTLFAPAEVDEPARVAETVYQPYTEVSPESYGLLYGAFGRPTTYYDGYPGCYFDADGRYYGYAQYGTLGPYYGYLDYPYISPLASPYITTPVAYDCGGRLWRSRLRRLRLRGLWRCGAPRGPVEQRLRFRLRRLRRLGYGGWGYGGLAMAVGLWRSGLRWLRLSGLRRSLGPWWLRLSVLRRLRRLRLSGFGLWRLWRLRWSRRLRRTATMVDTTATTTSIRSTRAEAVDAPGTGIRSG